MDQELPNVKQEDSENESDPLFDSSFEIKEEPIWTQNEADEETHQNKKIKLDNETFDPNKEIKVEPDLDEAHNNPTSTKFSEALDYENPTGNFSLILLARSKENTCLNIKNSDTKNKIGNCTRNNKKPICRNTKEFNDHSSSLLKAYEHKLKDLQEENSKIIEKNRHFLAKVHRLVKDFSLYQTVVNKSLSVSDANNTLDYNINKYNLTELMDEENHVSEPITKQELINFSYKIQEGKNIVSDNSTDIKSKVEMVKAVGEEIPIKFKLLYEIGKAKQLNQMSNNIMKREIKRSKPENGTINQYMHLTNTDENVHLHTGLMCRDSLIKLLAMMNLSLSHFKLTRFMKDNKILHKLTNEEQAFIVLMKFKLNLTDSDLAETWNIDESIVTRVIQFWLKIFYHVLYLQKKRISDVFLTKKSGKVVYARRIEVVGEHVTKDSVKTLKCLVGITEAGSIWFITDLYPLDVTDQDILAQNQVIMQTITRKNIIIVHSYFVLGKFVTGQNQLRPVKADLKNELNNEELSSTSNSINISISEIQKANTETKNKSINATIGENINKLDSTLISNSSMNATVDEDINKLESTSTSNFNINATVGENINKPESMTASNSSINTTVDKNINKLQITSNPSINPTIGKIENAKSWLVSTIEHNYSTGGRKKKNRVNLKLTTEKVDDVVNKIKMYRILENLPPYLSDDANQVLVVCALLSIFP